VFVKGLKLHKKQWKLIAEMIKTRTVVQIRTHAQKYFQKLHKARGRGGDFKLDDDFDIPEDSQAVRKLIRIQMNYIIIVINAPPFV
jgi:hypothetical protein